MPISTFKVFILRLFGAKIGKSVNIKPKVNIKYPWKLAIGDYTWIGENVWIDNLENVTIGESCCLSQGAMILCGNHNHSKSTFDLIVKPVVIEDGAWVGAQAVVCPGVTLKTNALLTVYSVATSDLEANSIYQGNPAVKIKDRIIE
jgi:putative colanic acid biosynthesis acetyltransferase WcaF